MASSVVSAISSHWSAISNGSRTVTGLLGFFSSVFSLLASSVLLLACSSCNEYSDINMKPYALGSERTISPVSVAWSNKCCYFPWGWDATSYQFTPPPAPITFNLDSRGTLTCLASYNDPIFNLKPLDPRSNTTIICLVLLDIFSLVIRDLNVCVGRGRGKTERQRKGRGGKGTCGLVPSRTDSLPPIR